MKQFFNNTYIYIYNSCYRIGLFSIRSIKQFLSSLKKSFFVVVLAFVHFSGLFFKTIKKLFKLIMKPFVFVKNEIGFIVTRTRRAYRNYGFSPALEELFLGSSRRLIKNRVVHRVAAVAAPVFGLTILLATLSAFNIKYGIQIEYQGEKIGIIESEKTLNEAERMVMGRIVNEKNFTLIMPDANLKLVSIMDEYKLLAPEKVCDLMIQKSSSEVTKAYGLYINGEFLGSALNDRAVRTRLDNEIADYTAKFGTDNPEDKILFTKEISILEGIYLNNSIRTDDYLLGILNGSTRKEALHTVKAKETVQSIAESYGMTADELRFENSLSSDNLAVGNELNVYKKEKFLQVSITKKLVSERKINFATETIHDSGMSEGFAKFDRSGVYGTEEVVEDVVYIDGVMVKSSLVSSTVISNPVNAIWRVGTRTAKIVVADKNISFLWPVDGGYISDYYGAGRNHMGIDIAAPRGTDIYAAESGVVIESIRSSSSYGRYIVIDHLNGVKTKYCHCSELYVAVGAIVNKGDVIAAVGMTGRATGNHLHIEVFIDGSNVNPIYYINR